MPTRADLRFAEYGRARRVVLPRLLADRLGLTEGLAEVVARAGFTRCGTGADCWSTPPARWRPARPR
ncbi:MAG: hypothetical protein ACXVRX_08505 [Solirubrobacteraceae bacterium]